MENPQPHQQPKTTDHAVELVGGPYCGEIIQWPSRYVYNIIWGDNLGRHHYAIEEEGTTALYETPGQPLDSLNA